MPLLAGPAAGASVVRWAQTAHRTIVRGSVAKPSAVAPLNSVRTRLQSFGKIYPAVSVPQQPQYNAATHQLLLSWAPPGSNLFIGRLSFVSSTPLVAGQTYAGSDDGRYQDNVCQSSSASYSIIVDQFAVDPSGNVVELGLQFACASDNGSTSSFGTFAYNLLPTMPGQGYYLYGSDGSLAGFGNDEFLNYLGDLSTVALNKPVVGMAITTSGAGDWMVAGDGGVFSFGDAGFYGSTGSLTLNKPVVGMAGSHDDGGYWFVASDGGIFSYGDAAFYGSTGAITLNKPIVGMSPTPDGRGYWLVASDGGVFAFGDAGFHGSTGALRLNKPIVGMAATPDGGGYWLVASDGGVFAFGDAGFYGSAGNLVLNRPIVGMTSTPDGRGYWFVASDGGVFSYGDAPFEGGLAGLAVDNVVGLTH